MEGKMGLLTMWRGARGRVLKMEYEDVVARMRNANPAARGAFLNNLRQCHEQLQPYGAFPASRRKQVLKEAKAEVASMWRSGDWPSALGLAIAMLNLESRHLPGEDAVQVKEATALLIKEARESA